ncbi:MAG: hypothetical protein ACE1Z6_09560 [Candidatus Methylomirabilales bacterium]|nr:hypothetical protein [candidate division NC10 bacterium]
MIVTRHLVAEKLSGYIQGHLPLADLVNWAEEAMREGEFQEAYLPTIRDAVARLGLADVAAFGLTWEDCVTMLSRLGYRATVDIQAVKP